MKQIVKQREDIVFFIKMLPLKMHPEAYEKSKAIICSKSISVLEDAFDKKPLPKADCESTEVDDTVALAEKLGISGTPAIVLPDGGLVPGFKEAPALIELIEKAGGAVKDAAPKKEQKKKPKE